MALKFYASVRMDIRRHPDAERQGRADWQPPLVCNVVKNKMAPPFKTAEFDMLYGQGISQEGSILDMALETDVVRKSGSWFTYNGEQLGQGRENVRKFLIDNPKLAEEISTQVKVKTGLISTDDQFGVDGTEEENGESITTSESNAEAQTSAEA